MASDKELKDGSVTNPRERWKKIDPRARRPVIDVMGEMRAPDLNDIPLERAVHYGSRDADATLRIHPVLKQKIKAMDLEQVSRIDHAVLPTIEKMQRVGSGSAPVKFWDDLEVKCIAQMDKAKWAIYQATGRDLNPGVW